MSLFPLVVIPAGVAVAAALPGTATPKNTAPTNQAPNGGALVSTGAASSGSTVGTVIGTRRIPVGSLAKRQLISGANVTGVVGVSTGLWGDAAPNSSVIDAALQEKLDLVKRYGQAAYDRMTKEAKEAAAREVSEQLGIDPPLDGTETWETIAKVAGGAAGAAALGWIPGGAAVGAVVGAYLGVKLEELISKNADEIKAWFAGKWEGIEDWVQGVGGDIEQGTKDAIDWIGGWF
jgi:hypothetical protein